MKNLLLLGTSLLIALAFTGCMKDKDNDGKFGMIDEAAAFDYTVLVGSTAYERVEVEALVSDGDCAPNIAGVIEYHENGTVTARVDFKRDADEDDDDDDDEQQGDHQDGDDDDDFEDEDYGSNGAHCTDRDGERNYRTRRFRGKDSDFEKVVVEPLVKAADCDYIVAGTICFYKEDQWVATIDFGSGTCDDIATKTTADGTTTFSLKDWGKGKGKG